MQVLLHSSNPNPHIRLHCGPRVRLVACEGILAIGKEADCIINVSDKEVRILRGGNEKDE